MKHLHMSKILIFMLLSVFSLGVLTASVDNHDNHGEHNDEPVLQFEDSVLQEFGVNVDVAKAGTIQENKLFPGEVTIHLDNLAHITPRFPGVVKKIVKHIGDTVQKGDVLAIIESNESLSSYELTAPLSGTIIGKNITLGESIEANSPAFEIADLSSVWVDFSVFQDSIGTIKIGQKTVVQLTNGELSENGVVSYVSPTIDAHTRTQLGRVVLSNDYQIWKPGMFVDVFVTIKSIYGSIVVPKTAIQKIENKTVVFVKNKNVFEPYPVELGDHDKKNVHIKSGLKAGMVYVSEGGFILKAELEKGDMGHGHAH
jgi:membrane fusion protein, heavy metal efflux system